jgi:hypothetical protein
LIRFLSLASIATLVGAYVLISTNSAGANVAGAVLLFIGAILGLFLMGRAAVMRVRDTAREVEATARSVVADAHAAADARVEPDEPEAPTLRT